LLYKKNERPPGGSKSELFETRQVESEKRNPEFIKYFDFEYKEAIQNILQKKVKVKEDYSGPGIFTPGDPPSNYIHIYKIGSPFHVLIIKFISEPELNKVSVFRLEVKSFKKYEEIRKKQNY